MANFGADIVMQGTRNSIAQSADFRDKLFRMAQMAQQDRQFNTQVGLEKEQMDYERSKPDPFSLGKAADMAIYKAASGQPLTPEEEAAIKAFDLKNAGMPTYTTDQSGRVIAGPPRPSIYDQIMGQQDAPQAMRESPAAPLFDMAQNPPPPRGPLNDEEFASSILLGESALPQVATRNRMGLDEPSVPTLPEADPYYASGPKTQQGIAEANIEVEKAGSMLPIEEAKKEIDVEGNIEQFKAQEDYKNQILLANKELETEAGKAKVKSVLDRMDQINEELKGMGAIVSGDMDLKERAMTAGATSGIGQKGRKVLDPKAQALADEYTKLQATLLPFYASATGLGAKSLDSDGERKAILGSFGDPGGIYESNKNQIGTLRRLFGSEKPQKQDGKLTPAEQQELERLRAKYGRQR